MSTEQPTFEEALKTLEDAVSRLEEGQLPLDQALAYFEDGIKGANLCRKLLQDVEGRVDQLVKNADGSLAVEEVETPRNGDA